MICKWEREDIKPGRIIGSPAIKARWMIGYIASADSKERRWVMISLDDGMVGAPKFDHELADAISCSGLLPSELLPK